MKITADRLVRLRWLLLSAVSAGACGGSVTASPDNGGAGGKPTTHATGGSSGAGTGGTVGGGGFGGTAGSGGAPLMHGQCVDPKPAEAGFVTCAGGLIHRVAQVACKRALPELPVACGVAPNTFVCDGNKLEYCVEPGPLVGVPTKCAVGCATDADCAEGELCRCGAMTGSCVAATCRVDADCADGALCRQVITEHGFGCGQKISFQCQLPNDACSSASDCGPGGGLGERCQPAAIGEALRCEPASGGACGRPYLVNGTPRVASLEAQSDWAAALDAHAFLPDGVTCAALADGWNQLGLMEHASVAAFARFTLQLLGLGAPHELIVESNRALADETRHAELCFGLAASFGSATAGPGKLDGRGALDRHSLEDVVLDTFLEGCIGETIAALEASEARSRAKFPAVQHVLDEIAADEARHAALAWRFVAWGAAQTPALAAPLRGLLEQELERAGRAAEALAERPQADDSALEAGGLVGQKTRAELRLHALREVVLPCLEEMQRSSRVKPSSARPSQGRYQAS